MFSNDNHTPTALLFCAGIAVCSVALGAEPGTPEHRARRAVARLALVEAIRAKLGSGAFLRVAPEQVTEAIDLNLAVCKSPTPEVVRGILRSIFRRECDQQLGQLLTELDPNGGFGLKEWAQSEKISAPHGQGTAKEVAERQCERDLASSQSILLGAYARGRMAVVDRQVRVAMERLALNPGMAPTAEQIKRAGQSARDRDGLVERTFSLICGANGRHLLREAEEEIKQAACGLVDNGLAQYRGQEKAIREAEPVSWTPQGIERELARAGAAYSLQRSTAAGQIKTYPPFFGPGDLLIRDTALQRFKEKVRAAVKTMSLQPSPALTRTVRDAIERSPEKHSSLAVTMEAVLPKATEELRQQLEAACLQRATSTASVFDTRDTLSRLPADIGTVLNDKRSADEVEWQATLAEAAPVLRKQVQEIRATIARIQAMKTSPELMNGRWWPSESQLRRASFETTGLEELLRMVPPERGETPMSQMIDEARELIRSTLGQRFGTGRYALTGQGHCVDRLLAEMEKCVRGGAHLGLEHWSAAYAARVETCWRGVGRPPAAVQAYPRLFVATQERIRGIVQRILQAEIRDAKRRVVDSAVLQLGGTLAGYLSAQRTADGTVLAQGLRETVVEKWQKSKLSAYASELGEETEGKIRERALYLADVHNRELARLKDERRQQEVAERARARLTKQELAQERQRDLGEPTRQETAERGSEHDAKRSGGQEGQQTQGRVADARRKSIEEPPTCNAEPPTAGKGPPVEPVISPPGRTRSAPAVPTGIPGEKAPLEPTTAPCGGVAGKGSDEGNETEGSNRGRNADTEASGGSGGNLGGGGNAGRKPRADQPGRRLAPPPASVLPFLLLVLLALACLGILAYIYLRKRRGFPSPFPPGRFGGIEEEVAAINQLKLAFERIGCEPESQATTLEDLRRSARRLYNGTADAWRHHTDSYVLPTLQFETVYVLHGSVAVLSDVARPVSSGVGIA